MKKLMQFFTEHALALVISAIAAVSLILIIIIFTLASSGSSGRKLQIKDISGSAFILKSDGQIPADKNTVLESGDVIITSSDGEVTLAADKDKYIIIEPDTTLYVNFTNVSEKGSVIVNISEGSAICRLDSKLPKNSAFEVRTPNAVISATGTVFRTDFTYLDTYGGREAVKLTEVECAEGSVDIQLYDDNASPADQLMMLAEGKSARLMTCADTARFEYLNSNTDLYTLSESTLRTFIRIAADRPLAYSLTDLNNAYQSALGISGSSEQTQTAPPETVPTSAETSEHSETSVSTAVITSETTETTASETSVTSKSVTVTDTETTTSQTTPISVAETTTKVYSVTTAPPSTTTASSEAVTTAAAVTSSEQTTSSIPAIKPAAPVTVSSEQETTAPVTEPTVTETTVPVSTIPWWEIINSAALTS